MLESNLLGNHLIRYKKKIRNNFLQVQRVGAYAQVKKVGLLLVVKMELWKYSMKTLFYAQLL